jgi:hypothetical protein
MPNKERTQTGITQQRKTKQQINTPKNIELPKLNAHAFNHRGTRDSTYEKATMKKLYYEQKKTIVNKKQF